MNEPTGIAQAFYGLTQAITEGIKAFREASDPKNIATKSKIKDGQRYTELLKDKIELLEKLVAVYDLLMMENNEDYQRKYREKIVDLRKEIFNAD